MASTAPLLIFLASVVGLAGLVSLVLVWRTRPMMRRSPVAKALLVLPSVLMLGLFYSLALHMHHELGAWPLSIGEHGFSASLTTHAVLATQYFTVLVLVTICGWPLACLLFACVPRWRCHLYCVGVHALAFLLCFGGMLLAPAQFLYWWWD